MLVENYKGIEINHDAVKDEFLTSVVIRKGDDKRPSEYLRNFRLQKLRDEIDKFLNVAAKKPVLPKAWQKGKYDSDPYEKVSVIIFNTISGTITTKNDKGRLDNIVLNPDYRTNNGKLFLSCKENDLIMDSIAKKKDAIKKLEAEINCAHGKLLPMKPEHFI